MNFCRRPRARARRRACARSVGLLWQKGNPILPITDVRSLSHVRNFDQSQSMRFEIDLILKGDYFLRRKHCRCL
jgi:hypothetical protein